MSAIRTLALAGSAAALLHGGQAGAAPIFFDNEAAFQAAATAAGVTLTTESFEGFPNNTNPPLLLPGVTVSDFLFVLDDNAGAADFATDGKMTLVSNSSDRPVFTFDAPVHAFAIDVIDVLNGPGVGTFGVTIDDADPAIAFSGELLPFFNVEFIGVLDLIGGFTQITLNTGQMFQAFNLDRLQFGAHDRDLPEPGTLALIGLGLVGVGWARRRRNG